MQSHPLKLIPRVASALLALACLASPAAWAAQDLNAVSYTHLDVYKRQVVDMVDDPSPGEETGAQACSSAAQTDARRIVFFMVGSYQPCGTDENPDSTSAPWTKKADRALGRIQILPRG